jgi:hypothetical protein
VEGDLPRRDSSKHRFFSSPRSLVAGASILASFVAWLEQG